MRDIPAYLYDTDGSLMFGQQRCRGYLMRRRVEYLVDLPDGPVGLRRATHVGALIEVVFNSHQTQHGTGVFYKDLKERIAVRLKSAHLQPQEQYFRDIDWWNKLDRHAAREELASNLDRLIEDDAPTTCLRIGVELQVLFDSFMCGSLGAAYSGVITPERIGRSKVLRETKRSFEALLAVSRAA